MAFYRCCANLGIRNHKALPTAATLNIQKLQRTQLMQTVETAMNIRGGVPIRTWCRPPPTAVLRENARNAWFCSAAGRPEGHGAARHPPPYSPNAWFCSAAGCPEGHGAARHPLPHCAKRVVLKRSGVPRSAWCRPHPPPYCAKRAVL